MAFFDFLSGYFGLGDRLFLYLFLGLLFTSIKIPSFLTIIDQDEF
jgi:hypothetical protein